MRQRGKKGKFLPEALLTDKDHSYCKAVEQHLAWKERHPSTVYNHRRFLERYYRFCVTGNLDWKARSSVIAFLMTLPFATRPQVYCLFNQFFSLAGDNTMAGIPRPMRKDAPTPSLSGDELRALLVELDRAALTRAPGSFQFASIRLRAMSLLALSYGIRISEMCAMLYSSYDGRVLRYVNKNRENIQVVIEGHAYSSLALWLTARAALPGLAPCPWLFCKTSGKPVVHENLYKSMKTLLAHAGVTTARGGFALYRHTIARHLAETGVNFLDIQQFLGHTRASTTDHYLHKNIGMKSQVGRAAVEALYPSHPGEGVGEAPAASLSARPGTRRPGDL